MAAPSRTRRNALALALALATAACPTAPASAAPLDVSLTFGSLPSAQGFTFVASGSHASVAEAAVFSADGTMLRQDTMGLALGTTGGGLYYQRLNGITTTETKRIFVRARCLAQELSPSVTTGQGGFLFGFANGSAQYGFSITTTKLHVLQGGTFTALAPVFDNTGFHDYVFEWAPGGTWQLYRDAVLVTSGSGGGSLAANRILFGDGTGGANARGDIAAFRFTQDLATAALPTTWGRVKSLYR